MANVKIKALRSFGGVDADREGKLVSMSAGDIREVSKVFADDVIGAGHAVEVKKKKAKVKHGTGNDSDS